MKSPSAAAARNGAIAGVIPGLIVGISLARGVLLVVGFERLMRAFRDGLRRQRLERSRPGSRLA